MKSQLRHASPRSIHAVAFASQSHSPQLANSDDILSFAKLINKAEEVHLDIAHGAPLALAAYQVATSCHARLAARALSEADVARQLQALAPRSAFRFAFVTRQLFKIINPHGHGSNSKRFSNETLGWFRQEHPNDSHLTDSFALLLCAAKWWTHEEGQRSVNPGAKPLTTADLDQKLKSFGFLLGERRAICRMLRRGRRN